MLVPSLKKRRGNMVAMRAKRYEKRIVKEICVPMEASCILMQEKKKERMNRDIPIQKE